MGDETLEQAAARLARESKRMAEDIRKRTGQDVTVVITETETERTRWSR